MEGCGDGGYEGLRRVDELEVVVEVKVRVGSYGKGFKYCE